MSQYLGQGLTQGQSQYFTFLCTAGQTAFTGTDSNGYTLNYQVGFTEVFLNGRRLSLGLDYTATDGSTITLLSAANSSDVLNVTAMSAFTTANWVTNAVNYVYVATASQTTFSGVDSNSQTLSYVAGVVQVSVNGIILPQSDYAALNGTSVVLASGVNSGDIVQIWSLRTVNPINISSWITNNLTNIVDYTYIATQSQTTFSGAAYAGGTLAYKANCIEVIVNGLVLTPADYTATNGTSVVLNVGCNADDTVVIRVFGNTTVAGVYTQAQSDSRYLVTPTQTILSTAGSGTYTVPAGVRWLKIRMIGGGGGGGGVKSGVGYFQGTTGGTTSFGSITVIGGSGGVQTSIGTGGTGGTGTVDLRLQGASGCIGATSQAGNFSGGTGAASPFGGGGSGGQDAVSGYSAVVKGAGGGGAGGNSTGSIQPSASGGAGEYIETIISSVSSTYSYTVGAGGAGGTTSGITYTGGAGGSGIIIIEEHYT